LSGSQVKPPALPGVSDSGRHDLILYNQGKNAEIISLHDPGLAVFFKQWNGLSRNYWGGGSIGGKTM